MTIILETERLILKPSSNENFKQVFGLLSDPDVMRYVSRVPRTEIEVREGLAKMLQHQEKHGFALGDLYKKETNEYIGRAGLVHLAMDDTQDEIEIGYQLHKKYWGQGYATEITQALITYGFDKLHLPKIVAVTFLENIASQKVLQKSGMQYIGESLYRGEKVAKFLINRI